MPKPALIALTLLLGARGAYYLWLVYHASRQDRPWGAWSERRRRG